MEVIHDDSEYTVFHFEKTDGMKWGGGAVKCTNADTKRRPSQTGNKQREIRMAVLFYIFENLEKSIKNENQTKQRILFRRRRKWETG